MSGWWFSCSARAAIRLTNATASANDGNSNVRASAPPVSSHPSIHSEYRRRRGKSDVRRDTNKAMAIVDSILNLVAWRHELLTEAGFPAHLAARLAGDDRWDLHALIELVERGCPPLLAVRVLAPLDEEEGRP